MNDPKPAFIDLSAAVEFIAQALDTDDHERLADACVEEFEWREDIPGLPMRREYRLREIALLADRHKRSSLRLLYAGRSFPSQDERFKLGGHGKELGHLHIDFVRSELGWQLENIWQCR
jgi:hypothetical protein